MKVIAQEEWSWTLLEDGERLVLSVLCGGAAMYELDIALSPEERASWESQGAAGLQALIDAIKARPSDFLSRRSADVTACASRVLRSFARWDGRGHG